MLGDYAAPTTHLLSSPLLLITTPVIRVKSEQNLLGDAGPAEEERDYGAHVYWHTHTE